MPDQELAFARHFADLPDPRVLRTRKHALTGHPGHRPVRGRLRGGQLRGDRPLRPARRDWLGRFLALPNGIPSHDTFNRVFAALDRREFAARFGGWMAGLAGGAGLRAIAVDGKACRSAPGDTASGCLHLVSAWAAGNGLILGQEAVADGSHEIAAIPELLRVLDLTGALVTTDAAGCQKAIAAQIRSQGGDSVLAVKGNQPALARAARAALEQAAAADFAGCDLHESSGAGHGRVEERYVAVIPAPAGLPAGWADAAAVVVVGR